MAFVVEDGTRPANANSYATEAAGDTYFTDRFNFAAGTWNTKGAEEKQSALIKSTQYLDASYRWKGVIVNTAQSLDWPRADVQDDEGRAVLSTEIPKLLQEAIFELA